MVIRNGLVTILLGLQACTAAYNGYLQPRIPRLKEDLR